MRNVVVVTVTALTLLLGCGASDPQSGPSEARSNEGTVSEEYVKNLPPCPSSWCGESTPCSSWDCRITSPLNMFPQQHSCRQYVAAYGTGCSDPSMCVRAGTCDGWSGACRANPGQKGGCGTTALGQEAGYSCGACRNWSCDAVYQGNLIENAPAADCQILYE
jgi:hypothetical protein